jgi:hypothetical protein
VTPLEILGSRPTRTAQKTSHARSGSDDLTRSQRGTSGQRPECNAVSRLPRRLAETLSLNEVLAALGYTKCWKVSPRTGVRTAHILRGDEVVHVGTADTTWEWLVQTGQIDLVRGTQPEGAA